MVHLIINAQCNIENFDEAGVVLKKAVLELQANGFAYITPFFNYAPVNLKELLAPKKD